MSDVNKPSRPEDEYFAKQELERRKKWAKEQTEKMAQDEREKLKQLHYMRCPKCGMEMQTLEFHGIKVDQCGNCHGVFFDAGEVEELLKHESGVVGRVLSIFR